MEDQDLITQWGLVVEGVAALSKVIEGDLVELDGLAASTFEVLLRLSRSPDRQLPMTQLASSVSFSSGGFTKFADRLEMADLVRRHPCATDRRVTWIELTERGSALIDRASKHHAEVLRAKLLGALSEADVVELGRIMRTLRDSLAR